MFRKLIIFVILFIIPILGYTDTHPQKDIHLKCQNNEFNIHELISKHINGNEIGVIPFHAYLTMHLFGGNNDKDIIFYYLDPRGSLFEEKSSYSATLRNIIIDKGDYWKSGYIDRITLKFNGTYVSVQENYSCEISINAFEDIKVFQTLVQLSKDKNEERIESNRKF